MEEDLVVKLESFSFTVNQAKVYLCIVQSGKTRVGQISKITQLHRQDIYKLLPKLEKMGLITRPSINPS
jgi:sugar-specific transcriptional regulator TrmB